MPFADEIRQDIEDAVFRMKPWAHETNPNEVVWGGWARMAVPLHGFQVGYCVRLMIICI